MDFASEFVVQQEEEQGEETYVDAYSMDDSDTDVSNDGFGAYESCIMGFEGDEEEQMASEEGKQNRVPGQKSSNPYNTVGLGMKVLLDDGADLVLTDDQMVICDKCSGMLSHLDTKIEEGDKTFWECSFCGLRQRVSSWPDFKDQKDVLYTPTTTSKDAPPMVSDTTTIPYIFVLDVSGSMSVPAMDREGIKGLHEDTRTPALSRVLMQEKLVTLSGTSDNSVDFAQIKSITRLQAVKAGLIEHLEKMAVHSPKRPVGLITFSNQLTLYGDCMQEPILVPTSDLDAMSVKQLEDCAAVLQEPRPLAETKDKMINAILKLEENGQTALGPALTVAIAMCKNMTCAKVVLCTDGIANMGVGRLDHLTADNANFYQNLQHKCKLEGVSVSIISFDDCQLVQDLGALPKETGGRIEKMTGGESNFRKALVDDMNLPIRAILVTSVFIVGSDMYIVEVGPGKGGEKNHISTKLLGNINEETKLCYRFAARKDETNTCTDIVLANSISDPNADHDEEDPIEDDSINRENDVVGQSQGGVNEATPFYDSDQKTPAPTVGTAAATDTTTVSQVPQPTAANGVDTSGSGQGSPDVEPAQKMVPFQFQATYTLLSGQRLHRVWTEEKKMTSDISKAKENASQISVVSNFCQKSAEVLLSKPKVAGFVMSTCANDLKALEGLVEDCKSSPPALKAIEDYREILLKLSQTGKIDDDIAGKLRKLEKGQGLTSA